MVTEVHGALLDDGDGGCVVVIAGIHRAGAPEEQERDQEWRTQE